MEHVVLKVQNGIPIYVKNVGEVHLGPDLRYGVAELNGQSEVVGGIVVMRYGENALKVVDGIKKKIEEIKTSLPPGIRIVPTYDRSTLIYRAIDTLREKLLEESIVVAVVSMLFLWHVRSALVAIFTLPVAIILSFIPMLWLGLTSNIMSLGGIAIAIGAMVDAAIIMVENAHKALEHFREEHGRDAKGQERFNVIVGAAQIVGRPLFFSLLVITVSFIPVFSLEAQEGRLFRPLAFTKTFSMFFAAFLGLVLVPVLMTWLIRGRITPEKKNPLNALLIGLYNPLVSLVLRFPWLTLGVAAAAGSHLDPIQPARKRIHAAIERGHDFVHAGRGARNLDQGSDQNSADPRSDSQKVSGGRKRIWQSWPSRHLHRPCAAIDVRDGCPAKTAGPMAYWYDLAENHRGNESGHQNARNGANILDADSNPDGDADHRLALRSRNQSFRPEPGRPPACWNFYRTSINGSSWYPECLCGKNDGRLFS